MRKLIFTVVFLVIAAACTAAGEAPAGVPAAETVGFNLGFITGGAVPLIVDGGRFNVFYGRAKEVRGLSVGMINQTDGLVKGAEFGFVNIADRLSGYMSGAVNITGAIEGCQPGFLNTTGSLSGAMAGFINIVSGDTAGALCGFTNSTRNLTGAAIGFLNSVDGQATGMEVGFVNTAKSMKGLQAGLLNIAEANEGLMYGFVNVSGGLDGVALGAVNIIKGGFGRISVYSSVETLYNLAFKSGKTVYGIVGFGYDHRDAEHSDKYTATCGLGVRADMKPFFLDIEGLQNAITEYDGNWKDFEWKTDLAYNLEIRLLPGITVFDTVDIYGGPSLKYCFDHSNIENRDWPLGNFMLSPVAGINIRVF